jgi:hypothetical protein
VTGDGDANTGCHDDDVLEQVVAQRKVEILKGCVVVTGVEIRDFRSVRLPEMFVAFADKRRNGFIFIAGESRGDVRKSRSNRQLVGQAILELGDAEKRARGNRAGKFVAD